MKTLKYPALAFSLIFALFAAASAQETQVRVVDEVVAQVNNNVITLSSVRREVKNAVDSLVQEGKKRDEAQKMVDEKQGELIANLIIEQLLIDKAKDLGLDSEVESMINQRLADIMKQMGAKTVEAVYAEMEKNNLNPNEVKEAWRRQIIRDQVIQRDIQAKLYWGFTGKELKDYYEKHKDKFIKPETVSLSEIFLGFAGRDETTVREKAKQLVAQLRGGADFAKLQKENSDPGVVTQGAGKIEDVKVTDLSDLIRSAIGSRKVGDVTNPLEANNVGVVILKIDARVEASGESVYNENAVRMAMMNERFPDEQKKYMAKLRKDGYISINDAYRPIVSPALSADEPVESPKTKKEEKTEPPSGSPAKTTKGAKGSKPSGSSSEKAVSTTDKPAN